MKKSARNKIRSAIGVRVRSNNALVGTWEDSEEKFRVLVRYNHSFVGTWQEVENPISETSVIYKIAVVEGHFVVSGIDEDDGTELKISGTRWDGASLHFTSIYPRTGHRVQHELRALKPGLVNHYGTSTDLEVWRKRSQKKPTYAALDSNIHRRGSLLTFL
jgi:hypothetical protein